METIDETSITNHAPLPDREIVEHEPFTLSMGDRRRDTLIALAPENQVLGQLQLFIVRSHGFG
jgi:hypothetical protein